MNITIRRISFGYVDPIFYDFSLDISNDESPLVILGPSGCGKTTLLYLIAGLLKPGAGEIGIEGMEKPPLSFVFQEPRLFPWLSVLGNVRFPLLQIMERPNAEKRALYFIKRFFLEDKIKSYPNELSGGQRQRVSIARAFAYPSLILFLDEPFQSLDIVLKLELMDKVLALLKEEERMLIMVTHDPREAVYLGRRIIVLGKPALGIVFDELLDMPMQDRLYGSSASAQMERKLLTYLAEAGAGPGRASPAPVKFPRC